LATKFCRDCGTYRPISAFSKNKRSRDGLSFYCREHLAERSARSRDARRVEPRKHRFAPAGLEIPDGHKWCPDCGAVKPLEQFPRTVASRTGRATYCLPCHNSRGKASRDKAGGSRSYHLTRRYGMTAAEADFLLEEQDGVCAICGVAAATHVDHDHETGVVRELLCFNCNGGLGQFKDDPDVLRAAAQYVERHRALQVAGEEGPRAAISTPERRSRAAGHSPGYARWLALLEYEKHRVPPVVPPELLGGS